MPRHSMTLSRHQDTPLQTPATLETLGSTSAVLIRLSDVLNRAALDRTQDWFFLNLPHSVNSPAPENVGDLLLFVADLVGNDRLPPGYLTISAGRHNSRLWQCKTPLRVLWDYSQVASLRCDQDVQGFTTLNSVESFSRLAEGIHTGASEGVHFAMVALHCLPQGIASDENRDLRALQAPGVCHLPHEDLDPDILAEEKRESAMLASQSSSKKQTQSTRAPAASSSAPASKPKMGRGGRNKAVTFSKNRTSFINPTQLRSSKKKKGAPRQSRECERWSGLK